LTTVGRVYRYLAVLSDVDSVDASIFEANIHLPASYTFSATVCFISSNSQHCRLEVSAAAPETAPETLNSGLVQTRERPLRPTGRHVTGRRRRQFGAWVSACDRDSEAFSFLREHVVSRNSRACGGAAGARCSARRERLACREQAQVPGRTVMKAGFFRVEQW